MKKDHFFGRILIVSGGEMEPKQNIYEVLGLSLWKSVGIG